MFNFRIQWQENQGQNPVTACMIRAHSSENQTSHIFVWRSWPTATTQLSQNSPHNPPNRFIYTQTYPHLTLTFYSTFLTTLDLIFSPFIVYFNALASKLGRHHLRVYTSIYVYMPTSCSWGELAFWFGVWKISSWTWMERQAMGVRRRWPTPSLWGLPSSYYGCWS